MIGKGSQLLVPAMQKFYSALRSLDTFNKNQDFFDNVSCLDNFLSEYRNVTFVIQKSLSGTDMLAVYEACRNKFFNTSLSKWLIEKRNEVLKEHPFELEKILKITVYDISSVTVIQSKVFSVGNDGQFSDLKDELKAFLLSMGRLDVYFSVEYIFREKGHEDNLFDKLMDGIAVMRKFLAELNASVGDDSELFCNLSKRIQDLNIMNVNKACLFIEDYVYYPTSDSFEKGSRGELVLPSVRIPLSSVDAFKFDFPLDEFFNGSIVYDWFIKTTALHIKIYREQGKCILPTFIIVYDDDTMIMKTFDASLRTTTYRYINEIANDIKSGKDIKAVMLINEMWFYSNKDVLNKSYEERVHTESPTLFFTTHLVNKDNESSIFVEADKVDSIESLKDIFKNGPSIENELSFLMPIRSAFKSIK